MLHRLILKVTKFQLPPSKRLGTVVKNILGASCPPPPCQIGLSQFGIFKAFSRSGVNAQICVGGENRGFILQTCMIIAAYNFSLSGSDYDWRKMCNTSTVLDINYWLANAQYFNLNFPINLLI